MRYRLHWSFSWQGAVLFPLDAVRMHERDEAPHEIRATEAVDVTEHS